MLTTRCYLLKEEIILPTPHSLSLSPYEGERDKNFLKGLSSLLIPLLNNHKNRVFKRGVSPSFIYLPPHDRNIYPYHGEGD